eukprot:35502-Pelagomonas_calceolata.AAC.1
MAPRSQSSRGHTHCCIDDSLLPSPILKAKSTNLHHSQVLCNSANQGYKHSDYIPLVANVPTNILGVKVKKFLEPALLHQNERELVRPIKPSDTEKPPCALNDPTYLPHTTYAKSLETLNSMHMAALSHLSAIEGTCAKKPII